MYIDKKIIAMKKELFEDLRKIGLPTLIYKKTNGAYTLLFNLQDSFKFLEFCDLHGIDILGAEGFKILSNGIQPDLDFIYTGASAKLFKEFLKKQEQENTKQIKDIYFEFMLSD